MILNKFKNSFQPYHFCQGMFVEKKKYRYRYLPISAWPKEDENKGKHTMEPDFFCN